MLTYDFHNMKMKFLRQHIQSGFERFLSITYQRQVLLCIIREAQPHGPILLCGHSQRSDRNIKSHSQKPVVSVQPFLEKKEENLLPDEAG